MVKSHLWIMVYSALFLSMLMSCNDFVAVKNKNSFIITDMAIQDGKVHFTGTGLTSVIHATGNSSNLNGFETKIVGATQTSLLIELNHNSLNSLEITRGSVLSFILSNGQEQTIVNLSVAPVVPTGAIFAFNDVCPAGWSELSSGKGRVLVGAGSGNTDALGAALTSRSIAAVGGLEYTTGIPGNESINATFAAPSPSLNFGVGSMPYFAVDIPSTTIAGVKADSNLPPYLVVRHCEKI
jgi:hypothetical protein